MSTLLFVRSSSNLEQSDRKESVIYPYRYSRMAASEQTIEATRRETKGSLGFVDRFMRFISSVRFGVSLLCILVLLSMIGMLIVQQNVNGFDTYFASLTPAERSVYSALGLFDIYHTWYFNSILLILSLNLVLASIDRFPSAWSYIVKPKISATDSWLKGLRQTREYSIKADSLDTAAKLADKAFRASKLSSTTTEIDHREYPVDADGSKDFSRQVNRKTVTVFGERGRWNRIGAYIVHVCLLTLFLGHFVANITGFDADVQMIPGDSSDKIQMIQIDLDERQKYDVQLPFNVACVDIQQKLIDPRGNIGVANTLDWRTRLQIDDPEYGQTIADVSMNNPLSYRGFRFFQAEASRMGSARSIELNVRSETTGETQRITIPRLGNATLPDGTFVEYDEFLPDFTFNAEGRPDTRSGEYNNPAAVLSVTPPGGERTRVFAFESGKADNIPVGAPKAGYLWRISGFEKVPFAHVLSIKYDPYSGAFIAWYFGGFGLIFALCFVFFTSHQRVWANIEPKGEGEYRILLGGDANRNHDGLEQRFNKVVQRIEDNS